MHDPRSRSRKKCCSVSLAATCDSRTRHGDCAIHDRAGEIRLRRYSSPINEERIMNKASSIFIAALATLALAGGAYAQTSGGANGNGSSSSGSTASPATNQMNGTNGGYGMPGATNSESGMGAQSPNSTLQPGMNNGSTPPPRPPKTNNTLATPSTVSPADQ
jgi:hypothetical protein